MDRLRKERQTTAASHSDRRRHTQPKTDLCPIRDVVWLAFSCGTDIISCLRRGSPFKDVVVAAAVVDVDVSVAAAVCCCQGGDRAPGFTVLY